MFPHTKSYKCVLSGQFKAWAACVVTYFQMQTSESRSAYALLVKNDLELLLCKFMFKVSNCNESRVTETISTGLDRYENLRPKFVGNITLIVNVGFKYQLALKTVIINDKHAYCIQYIQ